MLSPLFGVLPTSRQRGWLTAHVFLWPWGLAWGDADEGGALRRSEGRPASALGANGAEA